MGVNSRVIFTNKILCQIAMRWLLGVMADPKVSCHFHIRLNYQLEREFFVQELKIPT